MLIGLDWVGKGSLYHMVVEDSQVSMHLMIQESRLALILGARF